MAVMVGVEIQWPALAALFREEPMLGPMLPRAEAKRVSWRRQSVRHTPQRGHYQNRSLHILGFVGAWQDRQRRTRRGRILRLMRK